jgi:D-Tyr-tRNAtyr deacylase
VCCKRVSRSRARSSVASTRACGALIGVAQQDDERHVEQLVNKVSQLRVFQDALGKMNHSLSDIGGALLAVFAVHAAR